MTAMPSVLLLPSALLSREQEKLAHGAGLSLPGCTEAGCRLLRGTCRDQAALCCPLLLVLVSFVSIPVLFYLLTFSLGHLPPSPLFPADKE